MDFIINHGILIAALLLIFSGCMGILLLLEVRRENKFENSIPLYELEEHEARKAERWKNYRRTVTVCKMVPKWIIFETSRGAEKGLFSYRRLRSSYVAWKLTWTTRIQMDDLPYYKSSRGWIPYQEQCI